MSDHTFMLKCNFFGTCWKRVYGPATKIDTIEMGGWEKGVNRLKQNALTWCRTANFVEPFEMAKSIKWFSRAPARKLFVDNEKKKLYADRMRQSPTADIQIGCVKCAFSHRMCLGFRVVVAFFCWILWIECVSWAILAARCAEYNYVHCHRNRASNRSSINSTRRQHL